MRSYNIPVELAADGHGFLNFEVEVDLVDGAAEVIGLHLHGFIVIPLEQARVVLGTALFDHISKTALDKYSADELYDGMLVACDT